MLISYCFNSLCTIISLPQAIRRSRLIRLSIHSPSSLIVFLPRPNHQNGMKSTHSFHTQKPPSHEHESEWISERASEMSVAERVSELSSAEQANEWAGQANEQTANEWSCTQCVDFILILPHVQTINANYIYAFSFSFFSHHGSLSAIHHLLLPHFAVGALLGPSKVARLSGFGRRIWNNHLPHHFHLAHSHSRLFPRYYR